MSSRSGPFEVGGASGPIAVRAPGASVPASPLLSPSPSVSASPSPVVVDWVAILRGLDAARGAAFARPAESVALSAADYAGSAALRRDDQIRTVLVRQGLHADGFAIHVVTATALSATSSTARLAVTDTMDAYSLLDSAGRVVVRQPARPERRWVVTLRLARDGWRYVDTAKADSARHAT